ncbi:MAG: hypothetical protein EA423_03130 [Phycisphaerales bacterium]|nr:MAG: hypothetical protein EA423_03130 [Phycisphaerales bacterium]
MTTTGTDMLKMLGAGVRPVGPAAPAQPASPESADFAELLRQVRQGELGSGRPVKVPGDLGIDLSEDQLKRLAEAADRAEAAGAQSVVVMIDGHLLHLDVQSRQVLRSVELKHGEVLSDIDAVVNASEQEEGGQDGRPAVAQLADLARSTPGLNASLVQQLARLGAD